MWLLKIAILVALLVIVRKAAAMHKAKNDPIADDRCVSCDSADLEMLTAAAYRCNACGYEGGSGRKVTPKPSASRLLNAPPPAGPESGE